MFSQNSGDFRYTHSSQKSWRRFSRIASLLSSAKPDAVNIPPLFSCFLFLSLSLFSTIFSTSRSRVNYVLYARWKRNFFNCNTRRVPEHVPALGGNIFLKSIKMLIMFCMWKGVVSI